MRSPAMTGRPDPAADRELPLDLPAGAAVADPVAAALVAFLRCAGAAGLGHGDGRTLLAHLVGTYELIRRWGQPDVVAHAALLHSVYGTDMYARTLVAPERRGELIALAGEQAERLAHLFAVTPRGPLLAGTHAWLRDLPPRTAAEAGADAGPPADRDESAALILLHMANLADQAQARGGWPGRWLVRVRELAELIIDSEAAAVPAFLAGLATFTARDESQTRELYRAGLAPGADLGLRRDRLALAATVCPVVPEPCVWLAALAHRHRDPEGARGWAHAAQRRLRALGTAWDKRLTVGEWDELAGRLADGDGDGSATGSAIADPRALLAALRSRGTGPAAPAAAPAPTDAAGRSRFHRYVESLAGTPGAGVRAPYPGLAARPWHEPSRFPLAGYLEAHFTEIRDEILALDPTRFQRESERIDRTGDWDVVFFYERGRRHDEVCDACPVTTRGIDAHPAMRTASGLIYVSRMRPGTHIDAHRGPTNLRLRCHLGIAVPDGDCALRVAGDIRRWREGRCLVFDDFLEHEAWNRTDQDRIVLIADVWHPGLSPVEVALLEGLHGYASAYAQRLRRYWAVNAESAAGGAGG